MTRGERFKARLDAALQLRAAERYEDAEKCLLDLLRDHGEKVLLLEQLGGTYFLMDRYEEAAAFTAKAVAAKPRSESASLTLFHALFSLGRRDEAFREMFRFLGVASSLEYKRLSKELEGWPVFERAQRQAGRHMAPSSRAHVRRRIRRPRARTE